MGQKISQLTALSTTYADTDLLEVSVDTGGGTFVTRKMTFLQLRTAFTKLQANLDVNSFQITSASNGNIIIRPNGSGAVLVGGNSSQATELRFMEDSDNGTNYVALKVADALAASTTYTLPTADGTTGQVLSTNGTGTLSWATAAGGLTNFTEAANSSTPNGTVPVNSLTATGAATNIDAAIVPKGTGAFMLDIPDGTNTGGGNKRGQYAVDLQQNRSLASQVASGDYSFIGGGVGNVSSGLYASTSGRSNTSSNQSTFTAGESNTSSGFQAIAIGNNNTASGQVSIAIGADNISSGTQSQCFGVENISNGRRSFIHGDKGHTFGLAQRYVHSSWGWVAGDSQMSRMVLNKRTTNDTPTSLNSASGQLSYESSTILTLQNQNAIRFKGTIIGKKSGTTDIAAWDIDGLIVRGANAAATTLNISNVTLVQNTPAWGTPTLAADTTNGGLQVQVTGAAATNIQWTAVIETTEVIYA